MYYEKDVDERSYYLFFRGEHTPDREPHFTPPHCHDAYEFLVVKSGRVEGVLNGEGMTLRSGDVLFIDSYDIHSFIYSDCVRYSLVFSKEHCRMLSEGEDTLPNRPSLSKEAFARMISMLEGFYRMYENHIPNGLLVEGLVSFLLGTVESESGRVSRRENTGRVMVGVLEYIKNNYESELTLGSVASHFGYAESYFSALFNRFVQMRFTDYLNYIRYRRACELIREGASATSAAMRCGFGSMNTFYRAKNKFDKSPS